MNEIIFSPSFTGGLLFVKILFILISLVSLGAIIFFINHTSWLKRLVIEDAGEFFTYKPFGVKSLEKSWNKVRMHLDSGLESEYKLAVIEADSMMDDILKRMGYVGESLGERLKKLTTATIPNIGDLNNAHQLRNNIIHDPDYKLSIDETKNAIDIYEQAFRDLQAF